MAPPPSVAERWGTGVQMIEQGAGVKKIELSGTGVQKIVCGMGVQKIECGRRRPHD